MSDKDNEALGATNPNEEENLETEIEDTEDVDVLKSQVERDRIAKQQILARAKKAEAELKALKEQKPNATQNINNNLSSEDVEVSILKAQKVSDEKIAYLKKIAKLNGTSIIDAQSDELYLAWEAKKEAEEKSEKAKLGASRGSGSVKKEKTINSTGLSDEEHKALWREQRDK
jgi:hypothetical protein